MAKQNEDGITWCDETINPWWGCTRVGGSPACEDPKDPSKIVCYAERDATVRYGWNNNPPGEGETKKHFLIWGAQERRRFFGDKPFERIAAMNRAWAGKARRGRAFVMSFGDWAEGRPDQRPYLEKLWPAIAQADNVDFLMLTKRPQLIGKLCPYARGCFWQKDSISMPAEYLLDSGMGCIGQDRVWQGTTVETQNWLDIRWPHLYDSIRDHRYDIAWLSIEPQVERITLPQNFLDRGKRSWVVCGGQSGVGATPFDPAWADFLFAQCREAGVPFHMKQMSGNTKSELQAIPPRLMVREYPEAHC